MPHGTASSCNLPKGSITRRSRASLALTSRGSSSASSVRRAAWRPSDSTSARAVSSASSCLLQSDAADQRAEQRNAVEVGFQRHHVVVVAIGAADGRPALGVSRPRRRTVYARQSSTGPRCRTWPDRSWQRCRRRTVPLASKAIRNRCGSGTSVAVSLVIVVLWPRTLAHGNRIAHGRLSGRRLRQQTIDQLARLRRRADWHCDNCRPRACRVAGPPVRPTRPAAGNLQPAAPRRWPIRCAHGAPVRSNSAASTGSTAQRCSSVANDASAG